MSTLSVARKSPAMRLGAPTSTVLPVTSSIASNLLRPSSSCSGSLGLRRHSAIGATSPFFLTMSAPNSRSSSDDMGGKSSAAGWIGRTSARTCGRALRSVLASAVLLGLATGEIKARSPGGSWPGFRMSGGGGCAFGCLLLCGGFGRVLGCCLLSRTPPLGGRLVAYECARADVHHGRPPTLALHFVELVFRNTVQAAKLFDRHCE